MCDAGRIEPGAGENAGSGCDSFWIADLSDESQFGNVGLYGTFLYPGTIYSDAVPSVYPKKIGTGFIYTMNMTEEQVRSYELEQKWDIYHFFTKAVLGIEPKVLYSYDTRQFSDYTQYESSRFSAADKQRRYEEQFPEDCQAARKLGEMLAQEAADRSSLRAAESEPR